jgi:predicted transcriptional regulator
LVDAVRDARPRGGGAADIRDLARGGLEHEVIAVLATDGGAKTPGQVRDALGAELAYTTVMTVMTVMTVLARLSDKGLVTRHRAGGAFAYQAILDEDEIAARQMRRLLDCRDDRAAVLSRFVGTLSADDECLLVDLLRRTDGHDDADDTERTR